MIKTKYGFSIQNEILETNHRRLINQLWKIIPMRENAEDWHSQLSTVIIEITGLNEIFKEELNYSILLSKLEGISCGNTDFPSFRKEVFESLSLLGGLINE